MSSLAGYMWIQLVNEEKGRGEGFTSIVKSSSILTAFPNIKMYCMRFENSHMFRSLSSKLNSVAGSDDSISSLPRFRDTISIRFLSFCRNIWGLPKSKSKDRREHAVFLPQEQERQWNTTAELKKPKC